jgi:hypothetical protein
MKEKSNAGQPEGDCAGRSVRKLGGLKKRDLEIGAWAAIRKFSV